MFVLYLKSKKHNILVNYRNELLIIVELLNYNRVVFENLYYVAKLKVL